jgi:hypothetical protein
VPWPGRANAAAFAHVRAEMRLVSGSFVGQMSPRHE